MAVLNTWQKLTRVLPSKPFGDGVDGVLTVSANTPFAEANAGCSGSASSTTLTLDIASSFANGEVVLINQSRGTSAGQWEINKIASGGGTTALTLTTGLQYTYTDSGASQAQVVRIRRYSSVTINSGITWTAPEWDGNKGGILVFACSDIFNPVGSINVTYKGFVGGVGVDNVNQAGYTGEGTVGASRGVTPVEGDNRAANGNGGGGTRGSVVTSNKPSGGGGGGNANAGGNGTTNVAAGGTGGSSAGSADLITMVFGGGGGGCNQDGTAPSGGDGGGIAVIIAKTINTPTGTITLTGADGALSSDVYGGTTTSASGAGGSCLVMCQTASLGTTMITASAGTVPAATWSGGVGSTGRIAVHHGGAVTGTTNPTFNDTTDTSLMESTGGAFLMNFM